MLSNSISGRLLFILGKSNASKSECPLCLASLLKEILLEEVQPACRATHIIGSLQLEHSAVLVMTAGANAAFQTYRQL